ncbi:monooxygenase [Aliarcobacter cibarius]|uniref:monooxygenase n=1 Tax=Aliarcobacter cibarius TaxID=255507 RepID=UPI0010FF5F32|nr:monooxygenase [Aliarcobacter cibarius]TLT02671.1 monooxygenase [Aliarcobacter cibarius]
MVYILQVDFPHDGIFGEDFSNAFIDLANDISNEDGLLWKIWTENKDEKIAGGIYLFSNKNDAKRYLDKHTKRLESFGYKNIKAKIFDVNLPLSQICKADFLR